VRNRVLLIALVVAITSVMVFGGPASAGKPGTGTLREVELTGAEVVPTAGDPNGSGTGRFHLYPMKNKICYRVTVSGIQTATNAHIHKAPAGQSAPPLKELKAPSDGSSQGCVRLSRAKIMNIKNNPSGYTTSTYKTFPPRTAT
jgi:hypothetical protein